MAHHAEVAALVDQLIRAIALLERPRARELVDRLASLHLADDQIQQVEYLRSLLGQARPLSRDDRHSAFRACRLLARW